MVETTCSSLPLPINTDIHKRLQSAIITKPVGPTCGPHSLTHSFTHLRSIISETWTRCRLCKRQRQGLQEDTNTANTRVTRSRSAPVSGLVCILQGQILDNKYLLNEKVLTTFVRPIIDGIIIIQFEIFGRRLNQLKSSKS